MAFWKNDARKTVAGREHEHAGEFLAITYYYGLNIQLFWATNKYMQHGAHVFTFREKIKTHECCDLTKKYIQCSYKYVCK